VNLLQEVQKESLREARRARSVARLVGKTADLIIGMALWQIPGAAGACAALFYLLAADGFPGGRSVGKILTGLRVVRVDGDTVDFPSSFLRNLTVASPFLLYLVPFAGPFLAATLGSGLLLIETYLGYVDADGRRAGDMLAGTLVVETGRAEHDLPLFD